MEVRRVRWKSEEQYRCWISCLRQAFCTSEASLSELRVREPRRKQTQLHVRSRCQLQGWPVPIAARVYSMLQDSRKRFGNGCRGRENVLCLSAHVLGPTSPGLSAVIIPCEIWATGALERIPHVRVGPASPTFSYDPHSLISRACRRVK